MNYRVDHIAQSSFKYFFTKVYKQIWAPHFDEWFDLVWNNQQFLLECARGHGKTVFFVGFALWLAYREISTEILFFSQSDDQVKDNIMSKIEKAVMQNESFAHLRPAPNQQWGANKKTFKSGVEIRAESFGSSTRGAHPDWLFEDDPLKDKGGMNPEEQLIYHNTVIMGMAKKNTHVGVIGTPLDRGDLLEQLENNPSYTFKSYPARKIDGTPLFPDLFDHDRLKKIEETVGSFAWSREYMLQRIDTKNQIFKDRYRVINEKQEFPEFVTVRTIVDPAVSEKTDACDSAVVTVGIDKQNHRWEICTKLLQSDDQNLVINEILSEIGKYHWKYYDYALVVESITFQKWLANDLRQAILNKGWSINVIEVGRDGEEGKHKRIPGLQSAWESRSIHLLPESPLIGQFRYYRPRIKGFKIDGIDAFSWSRLEDVAMPVTDVKPYDPGCEAAWED